MPPPDHAAQPEIWLDSVKLRTIAHPLRSRLLTALRLDGPATATELAGSLDTNTGATSYHLRKLAEVGLVVEDVARGTGRQRWWQAVPAIYRWRGTDFNEPDDRAAVDWLASFQLRFFAELAGEWIDARDSYPEEWQAAAAFSDHQLRLTPQGLRALNDELDQVVQRYLRESTPAEGDTEQVIIFYAGFPRGGATR